MAVTITNRLVQKRVIEALQDHSRWSVIADTHLRRDDGLWVKWDSFKSKVEVGTDDHKVPQFWYSDVYQNDPWLLAIIDCHNAIIGDERKLPVIKLLGIEFP